MLDVSRGVGQMGGGRYQILLIVLLRPRMRLRNRLCCAVYLRACCDSVDADTRSDILLRLAYMLVLTFT